MICGRFFPFCFPSPGFHDHTCSAFTVAFLAYYVQYAAVSLQSVTDSSLLTESRQSDQMSINHFAFGYLMLCHSMKDSIPVWSSFPKRPTPSFPKGPTNREVWNLDGATELQQSQPAGLALPREGAKRPSRGSRGGRLGGVREDGISIEHRSQHLMIAKTIQRPRDCSV